MSFEVKQKITYIVTLPEGDKELSAEQLGEEIKQAKKEIAVLQRFVDSAVSMLGGYKQEYVKPKIDISEEAISKVYNAVTYPMFVTDVKMTTKLSEFTIYNALNVLIERKLIKKYRSAENKRAMSYDRVKLPSIEGKAGAVEMVAVENAELAKYEENQRRLTKASLELMREH